MGRAYIGDILWRLLLYVYPQSQVPSYSQYMRSADAHAQREESGQEIVDGLIGRLKNRKEAARHGGSIRT